MPYLFFLENNMCMKYIMFSYPQPETINCAFPVVRETIPKSKLGYATNNAYPEFPANMQDSRSLIASYQPEAILNENLIKQSGVTTNWMYRNSLTNNSQKIAQDNFREACNDTGYFERFLPDQRGDNRPIQGAPLQYSSYDDTRSVENQPKSDLKELYLSREQLEARKTAPVVTQDELFRMSVRRN